MIRAFDTHSPAFGYGSLIDRQSIIARWPEREADLHAQGVLHAALFGSRARGDARPDSDTEVMIEIDPEMRLGVWGYAALKKYISGLLRGRSMLSIETN